MVGRALAAPLLTLNSGARSSFLDVSNNVHDHGAAASHITGSNASFSPASTSASVVYHPNRWTLNSTAKSETLPLSNQDQTTWDSCREVLSAFDFDITEKDKMLGKAFGHVPSPYWGEDRKQEVPTYEVVKGVVDYLKSLGLSDEDLFKVLKKFPEVMGCSLEEDLKKNVGILEKEWGIKGKTLRSLLLRNPKVLGFNVDCKGDCMAQCTRCWVRF
ncbi:hypothetical protein LINPERPRIM_LOCUS4475 [Linum perenne]